MQPRVAVLVTGTYREIEFLFELFPYMAGEIEYDIIPLKDVQWIVKKI